MLHGQSVRPVGVVGVYLAILKTGMRANMHQYSGFKGGNLPFVLGKVAKVALFKPRFVNVDVGAFQFMVFGQHLMEGLPKHSADSR